MDACSGSGAALRNHVEDVGRYTIASLGNYDWRGTMSRVHSPTLVIHGDKDFIPVATAR